MLLVSDPRRTREAVNEASPELSHGSGNPNARLRHYVENLDHQPEKKGASKVPFKPKNRALCGYEWDQLFVPQNGSICQACVDELKRRGQG